MCCSGQMKFILTIHTNMKIIISYYYLVNLYKLFLNVIVLHVIYWLVKQRCAVIKFTFLQFSYAMLISFDLLC